MRGGSVIGFVRVVAICVPMLICCSCGHVPDRSLRAVFSNHEADFEELRMMFTSDSQFTSITPRRVVGGGRWLNSPPEGLETVGLSPERYAKYLNMFRTLRVDGGIGRPSQGGFVFQSQRPSLLNGGTSKGYIYSIDAPIPCVDDLETYKSTSRDWIVFARLKGHWYLYKQQAG